MSHLYKSKDFNPELMRWLNDRDYCSGDWPYGVPVNLLAEADLTFGGGFILDEDGYPGPAVLTFDPIYLGF